MEGDDSKVKIDNPTPSIPVGSASSMYDVPSAGGSTSGPSTALTQESRLPNHRSDAGNTLLVYGDEVDWSDGSIEERELSYDPTAQPQSILPAHSPSVRAKITSFDGIQELGRQRAGSTGPCDSSAKPAKHMKLPNRKRRRTDQKCEAFAVDRLP